MTKLEQAARALLAHWDTPAWKYLKPTGDLMADLREALAEPKKPEECAKGCPPFQVCDYCQKAEQTKPSQLADANLEPVASVEEWVARPHPEDIKRLEEQQSIGYWDSRLNDVCWHEGLINADLQHGQPLYAAPLAQQDTHATHVVRTKDPCHLWQDLTDDAIHEALHGKDTPPGLMNGIRAIIAKFKEKNNVK